MKTILESQQYESEGQTGVLDTLDFIVIALLLLLSSGIGLYFRITGGRQGTFNEFMFADQGMSILPVSFSLMASFMSAITLLGVVQEMYMYGTQFIMINFSYIIATPLVCYFYLPVFFRLQKPSVYEYLELRFGYTTRLFASLAFSIQMILYQGIVLYAPALALAAVTGLSQNISILLLGFVCTFYSAMGGIKAVLITDVLQSLLMFASVCIVIVTGLGRFSISEVFKIAGESGRLEFFIMDPDPRTRHTLWTQVIGGMFTYLSLYAVNQAQVQRLLTVRSLRRSQAAVWIQWPILMILSLSTAFAGLIIYAHYKDCDPLLNGEITNPDQLLPKYIMDFVSDVPGLPGLFIAGVFSGSLSTVSSSLNSLTAVTISDYIQPLRRRVWPLLPATLPAVASPVISTLFGCACLGMAYLTAIFGSSILQASFIVFGAVGGPLLGLFTLGMTTKRTDQKAAVTGLVIGLALCMWIGFGQPKPPIISKPRSTDGCNDTALQTLPPAAFIFSLINSTEVTTGSVITWAGAFKTSQAENLLPHERFTLTENGQISFTKSDSLLSTTDSSDGDDTFNFLHELYAISYAWVAAIGSLTTYSVAAVISCVLTQIKKPVDPMLLASWCRGQGVTEIEEVCSRAVLNSNEEEDIGCSKNLVHKRMPSRTDFQQYSGNGEEKITAVTRL